MLTSNVHGCTYVGVYICYSLPVLLVKRMWKVVWHHWFYKNLYFSLYLKKKCYFKMLLSNLKMTNWWDCTHHFPFLKLCLKCHVLEVWVDQLVKVCRVLMGILVLHPEKLKMQNFFFCYCTIIKDVLFCS